MGQKPQTNPPSPDPRMVAEALPHQVRHLADEVRRAGARAFAMRREPGLGEALSQKTDD